MNINKKYALYNSFHGLFVSSLIIFFLENISRYDKTSLEILTSVQKHLIYCGTINFISHGFFSYIVWKNIHKNRTGTFHYAFAGFGSAMFASVVGIYLGTAVSLYMGMILSTKSVSLSDILFVIPASAMSLGIGALMTLFTTPGAILIGRELTYKLRHKSAAL